MTGATHDRFCCFRPSSDGRTRVLWELNTQCNLACSFCDAAPNVHGGLATDAVLAGLELLVRWGVGDVIFSGGEPLLRPDLLAILRYAADLGLDVDLCTNGTLVDADVAADLAGVLTEVSVSIDSADAALHDRGRRRSGAWAGAVRAVRLLAEAGLDVHAISVVSDDTAPHLDETVAFIAGLGAESVTLLGLMPNPRLPGLDPLSPHVRQAAIGRLGPLRQAHGGLRINTKCLVPRPHEGCGAGASVLGVDARGRLLPCILLKDVADARPLLSYVDEPPPWHEARRFELGGAVFDESALATGGCPAARLSRAAPDP